MEKEWTRRQETNGRQQDDEIDLIELFFVLWKHIIPIIIVAIIGGICALAVSMYMIKPTYVSSSKIYILSASSDSVINLSDLQIGSNLATDYMELITCRPLLEEVENALGLDWSIKKLQSAISVNNGSGNRIITIKVTTGDPELSADIANEIAKQSCIFLPKIMGCEPPNIVETALVPTTKASPSYTKNTILGGLFLAVVVSAVYIVKHLLNDSLTTASDVYKYLGIQPLASIPDAAGSRSKKYGYGYGYGENGK